MPSGPSLGLVDVNAYRHSSPQVGDIVTFRGLDRWGPGGFNKRVVGLPGDAFQHAFDQVWRNGEPLVHCMGSVCEAHPAPDVRYAVLGTGWGLPSGASLPQAVRVPEGQVYVLGDNLAISGDSRWFGAVPRRAIEGKVVAVVSAAGFKRLGGT